ncbi:MAG: hypothetical protein DHS20C17_21040 [Cyclobacteriaceae bacterium]|nr:MAG: hypothetical protein DHS20C17_21040 [Cyclobacteriaceae bacterium]
MQYSDIEEIVIRSIIGTANSKELQQLEVWRKSSDHNELSYQLLNEAWVQDTPQPQYPDYQSLEQHIVEEGFKDLKANTKTKNQWHTIYSAAAGLILICVIGWFSIKSNKTQQVVVEQPEQVITYNPTGHKSKITLPDNSVIYLNSESTLCYQKGFSDSIRYVKLKGEAYFEVEPDATRPFVVDTEGITTMALGTSFNIRNYPEDCTIKVSLLTGKVKVTDNQADNEVFLEPMEHVAFTKDNRALKMSQLDQDDKSVWKDGVLVFRNNSFQHIIKSLERTYDVDFDTSGYSSTDWSYTGKFDNLSLQIVLTRIGYSEGFTSEIEGRRVRILNDID